MIRAGLVMLALALVPGLAQAAAGVEARGAVVRWLDTFAGTTGDLELSRGQTGQAGRLTIHLDACRYPAEGEPTEAFAYLTIQDSFIPDGPVFSGWMVAEAPALSALDHHRYDVWVLRCLTE